MRHRNKKPKEKNAKDNLKNRLCWQAKELEKEIVYGVQKGEQGNDWHSSLLQ